MSTPSSSPSPAYRPLLIAAGFIAAALALVLIVTGVAGPAMWLLVAGGLFVGVNSTIRLVRARNRR
jgi:hypothetical protein